MAINSRQKGKRVELELTHFLKSLGFADARRSQQYNGAGKLGDVECAESLPRVHFECKGVNGMDLGTKLLDSACEQAARDCPSTYQWVVFWKKRRTGWRMTFEHCDSRLTIDREEDMAEWLKSFSHA